MTDNKVALITGASRGIGKACAIEMAKAGFDVVITYAGNTEAAEQTIKELKEIGVNAEAYRFDVSDKEQVDKALDEIITKYGISRKRYETKPPFIPSDK